MKEILSLSVPGRPVPKGRPRFGKNGHVYTPKKTRDAQESLAWQIKEVLPPGWQPVTALSVSLCFLFGTPRKELWDKARVGRPDLDNLVKLALDSLNDCGIDDSWVAKLSAERWWEKESCTSIVIEEE